MGFSLSFVQNVYTYDDDDVMEKISQKRIFFSISIERAHFKNITTHNKALQANAVIYFITTSSCEREKGSRINSEKYHLKSFSHLARCFLPYFCCRLQTRRFSLSGIMRFLNEIDRYTFLGAKQEKEKFV